MILISDEVYTDTKVPSSTFNEDLRIDTVAEALTKSTYKNEHLNPRTLNL
jgi:hypothetical protein